MVDDRPEDSGPSPDSGRPKREPPTIDLEASEVTSETQNPGSDAPPEPTPEEPSAATPPSRSPSPWVVAVISGAVAASLVIGVGWILGWPEVPPNAPVAPQVNAATIDGLVARVASVEAKTDKPPSA